MNQAYLNRFKKEQRLVDLLERRVFRRLIRSEMKEGLTILDVPCGYGRFGAELQPFARFLVHGDRSMDILRFSPTGNGRARVCCDARSLPFKDRAFDWGCVIRLWHHLHKSEDRRAILGELRRVCGTRLVVTYYAPTPLHRAWRGVTEKLRTRVRIHLMSSESFLKEARQAGWTVLAENRILPGLHAQTMALLGPC